MPDRANTRGTSWLRGLLGRLAACTFFMFSAIAPGVAQEQMDKALLDMPTAQDLRNWGFTVDEFQSLVRRKFDLLTEESRLMEQLTDRPYGTADGMRHEAVASVQKELFLRRLDPRSQSFESFRQRGTHTTMLQAAERDLFDRLQQKISTLRQRVQIIAESKAPTRPVEPPAPSSAANPQRTVLGTPGAGGTATPSGSPQAPSTGRDPVQPNPNYQGPPLMDDPNLRGPWKPLGQAPTQPPEPWPNPNYQGPPAMDDPNARGPWKPVDASPAKPPGLAETHGTTIALALANLEGILRCREAEVPARDCLLGLMVGNGIAATMPLAAQLLSAATLVKLTIGGQVLLIGKGAWDSYQFLDGLQGALRAEYNAWLAKRNREDWLRNNMETRDMPGYIAQLRRRIDDTLAPLATGLEARCADLWQMAAAAAPAASHVAVAMEEMPEKSALLAMEPYYDKSEEALANERALRRDLEGLRQAFAALDGTEAGIAAFRQSAEGLSGRARSHMAVEDELAAAKGTLDRAFALMARMRNLSAGAVPYERLEARAQEIRQIQAARAGQADKLRIEVQALKRAFPRKEIETWMEAELLSLDAAIDSHLRKDCNPDEMLSTHRAGAGAATDRVLDAQNNLEPVDLLHARLSRLAYGTGREVLGAVQDMLGRIQPTARDDRPAAATGGFQDEGGSVEPSRHDQTPPEQTPQAGSGFTSEGGDVRQRGDDDSRQEPPSGQGGFVDEGTVVGTGDVDLLDTTTSPAPQPPVEQPSPPVRPPRTETVTYFDRPWLPHSWQTSGDARQTRAEIYQAASRLGWAAALAEYAPATADNLIVGHLNATAIHLQRANQASFAPHKAWPDWQRRQQVYGQWIRHLTQGSATSRDYFRKGLDGLIRTEARTLREQILTQTPHQAGGLSNCDSAIFDIGYDLAHAAQVQSIALDGMNAGKDKAWARQLMNKASGSAASAGRNIQLIKPTPQQKGCPDYTVLSQELNQVKSRLNTAAEPELHAVWTKGLAIASAGSASASACSGELEGYWWHPTGMNHIIHWVKKGNQYEGLYERVTGEGKQWWKESTAYQWVNRTDGNTYVGKNMPYNYRERRHYIDDVNPLKIRVFGDIYFNGPDGIHYGGYAWKRLSTADLARLQSVRQSLGGEILMVPGEKRWGDVETIKFDCTADGKSHIQGGQGRPGAQLLGQ